MYIDIYIYRPRSSLPLSLTTVERTPIPYCISIKGLRGTHVVWWQFIRSGTTS